MDRNKVQEALKPITDGLFGKQRPVRYERPHFKVRPLVRDVMMKFFMAVILYLKI